MRVSKVNNSNINYLLIKKTPKKGDFYREKEIKVIKTEIICVSALTR